MQGLNSSAWSTASHSQGVRANKTKKSDKKGRKPTKNILYLKNGQQVAEGCRASIAVHGLQPAILEVQEQRRPKTCKKGGKFCFLKAYLTFFELHI